MDLSKLSKSELEQLLGDVIDATVDELAKGEIFAGGPTDPSHAAPGLADDFSESDAMAEKEGATAKAAEPPFGDDDEEDEDEKEKKAKEVEKADAEKAITEKANAEQVDLLKSQMKGMVDLGKAVSMLNEKIDRLAKSKARERKTVMNVQDIEAVEKAKVAGAVNEVDQLIASNPRAFAKALVALQEEGKVPGRYITDFELYGTVKIPDAIKKSVLQKADLMK